MAQPRVQSDSSSISSSLLVRVRHHDAEAWRRLVHVFGPLVREWCRRSGLQQADLEDVTQEVFRAVNDHIGRFRRDRASDSFRGWLRQIAQNKIRDHFRSRNRDPVSKCATEALEHLFDAATIEREDKPPPPAIDPYRRALGLLRAEFREQTWQAFLRVAVHGDKPADVAEDLGLTVNAVRKAKARVLSRLREEFGDLLN